MRVSGEFTGSLRKKRGAAMYIHRTCHPNTLTPVCAVNTPTSFFSFDSRYNSSLATSASAVMCVQDVRPRVEESEGMLRAHEGRLRCASYERRTAGVAEGGPPC